ncbi:protein yellow-like isoform X2 [Microplitis mediator]|uniref:protein yellow-like isoform X2 n=1 Tax=Microplitis mediator TaxID=375433 RepID=UPI0025557DC5|nr:protein yellow-like isoform X2 [Microplitis mediator]
MFRGITNVVPLLMSMTLLGLREFNAQNVQNFPSHQDLELPLSFNNDNPNTMYKVATSSSLNADILNSMRFGRLVETFRTSSENQFTTQSIFGINDINVPNRDIEPPLQSFPEEPIPGAAMELIYAWKTVDYEFASDVAREQALLEKSFIPENNMPLGIEFWRDKVFITLPKWRPGVPATLTTVPRYTATKSPKLRPYPSWGWHYQGSCGGMTSVFRIQVDECDRLWVLDSGSINLTETPKKVCPPAIFIFDLKTDRLLKRYQIPDDQVKEDSLWSNIVVDIRNGDCNSAKAYLSDVWRFAMIIYDLSKDTSFRIQHHFFFPNPFASKYELHGIRFQWMDGILGLALSPIDVNNDRILYFHPMSSFSEFAVSTAVLVDQETAESNPESFAPVGEKRAKDFGHSSGSAIDKNGVMFFNMVTRDSVWCWDTRKEYLPHNLGLVGVSNETLVFPNDIRIDNEERQSFWTISNRLPMFLYGPWNPNDINFRVYRAYVDEAVKDTVCDPNYVVPASEINYDQTC